jgi:outer membrane protein assembly factor BamB
MNGRVWRLFLTIVIIGGAAVQLSTIAAARSLPAESNATFRGGFARTGEAQGPGPVGIPELKWASWIGLMISSSPAVVDGVIYVGSVSPVTEAGGALHAVNAETGEELWQRSTMTGDAIFAAPTVVDGVVYAGSYDGIEFAVDATTGEELWRFQAEGSIFVSAAVANGVVTFGDDAGFLYGLDAATGELVWRFVEGQAFDFVISSSPAVVDDVVYFVTVPRREEQSELLVALDITTGAERWRINGPTVGMLRGTPAIANGMIYLTSTLGSLYAIDLETGAERWRFDGNAEVMRTNAAVGGGFVYFGTTTGQIFAVDAFDGSLKWQMEGSEVAIVSSPTIVGESVYFGDADGILGSMDAVTGEWQWRIDAGSFISNPAVVDGMIYIGGDEGLLRAFGSKDYSALHRAPT